MSVQELKDAHNHVIGRIETRGDGTLVGRDAHNSMKGTYDPKRDETRDEHNHLVGKGNLLSSLIMR